MYRFTLTVLCLFAVGCQPEISPEIVQSPDRQPKVESPTVQTSSGITTESDAAEAKELESAKIELPSIAIKFSAGEPDSKMAPRYSPSGKLLPFKPFETPAELGFDGLQTEVLLGTVVQGPPPLKLLVTRASAEAAYTNLFVDMDRNGKFDDPVVTATMSDSRGKIWSNFTTTLKVSYFGHETVTEDYPVAFWLTVAAPSDRPDGLRMSRRGYKLGEVVIGDTHATVVLSDSNNDAVFGFADWWELRADDTSAKADSMRRVGDFAWLGESAFKLEIDNDFGGSGRLVPISPGITREADALARDPYGADRAAVKATKPLEFRHDVDAAIAEAVDKKVPCFIKFETTWCGPCKTMTQLVFTAKDVVDASEGVICVMVDGDERKDLVERYEVKAYPTGVMVAGDGAESGRFIGYQKVTEMAAFLKNRREK